MVSDAHLTGAKDSLTTSSVALVLTTAIAEEQRDWGLADDAEEGLETLPPPVRWILLLLHVLLTPADDAEDRLGEHGSGSRRFFSAV